jgi:putative copper export protein
MLSVSWGTVRLFLHMVAATVWVGGQVTLAGLVPVLRGHGPETTRSAARRFGAIAWPAFAVLVVTGVWNVVAERGKVHGPYRSTLVVKLAVVALSGLAAYLHGRARSSAGLAVWGALAGLFAIAAVFLGVLLAG